MKSKLAFVVFLIFLVVACWLAYQQGIRQIARTPAAPTPEIGQRTKEENCQIQGALQDKACTPGAVLEVSATEICQPGYARKVRKVYSATKRQVYQQYGVVRHGPGEFEVDHLVPLELGGSNDIANLWPESAYPKPGFHEKDKVEDYLHRKVCKEGMDLKQAQWIIANNWLDTYHKMSF
jgi:hypothetical protein